MKKVVFAIAAMCIGYVVNAQVFLGGNLSLGISNSYNNSTNVVGSTTSESSWDGPKNLNFIFTPNLGYKFNDKWAIGVIGGFDMGKHRVVVTTPDEGTNWVDYRKETITTSTSWQVSPYFRYATAHYGKLSFFMEYSFPFVWNTPDKIYTEIDYNIGEKHTHIENNIDSPIKSFSWGISIVPGFNYAINGHCSMDLYVDVLKLAYKHTRTTNYMEGENWSKEVKTYGNDFYIGINSLANSSLFRLGFTYTF